MIRWPHIGMYGEFAPCEEGVLAALNNNFFLLDVLTQGSVFGFIDELPSDPATGDTYIVTSGIYAETPGNIVTFDGENWIEIEPKPGYLMFNQDDLRFYWYDGSDWVLMANGDVGGPGSSTDNAIARFDGTTGKLIQDSIVTISDLGLIEGAIGFETSGYLLAKYFDGEFLVDSTSSGGDQDIDLLDATVIKFTGALSSIQSIETPGIGSSRFHILMNSTGSPMVLKDNSNIRTGTGADIVVAESASVWIAYDPDADQWAVVGGSGGGGGGAWESESISATVSNPQMTKQIAVLTAGDSNPGFTLAPAIAGAVAIVHNNSALSIAAYPYGSDVLVDNNLNIIPPNARVFWFCAESGSWVLLSFTSFQNDTPSPYNVKTMTSSIDIEPIERQCIFIEGPDDGITEISTIGGLGASYRFPVMEVTLIGGNDDRVVRIPESFAFGMNGDWESNIGKSITFLIFDGDIVEKCRSNT